MLQQKIILQRKATILIIQLWQEVMKTDGGKWNVISSMLPGRFKCIHFILDSTLNRQNKHCFPSENYLRNQISSMLLGFFFLLLRLMLLSTAVCTLFLFHTISMKNPRTQIVHETVNGNYLWRGKKPIGAFTLYVI